MIPALGIIPPFKFMTCHTYFHYSSCWNALVRLSLIVYLIQYNVASLVGIPDGPKRIPSCSVINGGGCGELVRYTLCSGTRKSPVGIVKMLSHQVSQLKFALSWRNNSFIRTSGHLVDYLTKMANHLEMSRATTQTQFLIIWERWRCSASLLLSIRHSETVRWVFGVSCFLYGIRFGNNVVPTPTHLRKAYKN